MSHTVVDTGPGDTERLGQALRLADTVIVPSGARGADVAQLQITMTEVEKVATERSLVYGVLMTFVRLRTGNAHRAPESIDRDGLPRYDTMITLREELVDAWGTVPPRPGAYADLMAELDELHKETV